MVETIDITNVFTSNFEIILGKLLGEELEGFLKALYSIEPKIDTSRVVNFLLLDFDQNFTEHASPKLVYSFELLCVKEENNIQELIALIEEALPKIWEKTEQSFSYPDLPKGWLTRLITSLSYSRQVSLLRYLTEESRALIS